MHGQPGAPKSTLKTRPPPTMTQQRTAPMGAGNSRGRAHSSYRRSAPLPIRPHPSLPLVGRGLRLAHVWGELLAVPMTIQIMSARPDDLTNKHSSLALLCCSWREENG
mmetsp:Transcript_10316/g.22763  ORF Transcript_10316/g.22763 Transcript_10316/m.22763 type:complete len:108 (+) Transcript_10316:939-1262(+)